MADDYDVLVLGAGNAGLAAAGVARAAGRRVLLVEGRDVGGVCPLRGCVPKKVLVAAAQALDAIERAGAHQISVGRASLDWSGLMARKESFVTGVPAEFEKSLKARGIDLVRGRAHFTGRHEVCVGGRHYTGDKIVVATGSTPRPLPIPGAGHLLTSDDLLDLPARPDSITFVGAGVIAFEFAHLLARAGTRVTLLEVAPRVLPSLDADAALQLAEATRALGVQIETSVSIDTIEKRCSGFVVHYRTGARKTTRSSEQIANGAGRVADLAGLELAAAGITLRSGQVDVEPCLRSRENPDVYFAGDAVPGRPQLSPVATYEGRAVGYNLTHTAPRPVEYGFHPAAVYTVPALASVGLTEEQATSQGLDFEVRTNDMRTWRSARTHAESVAWAKVLLDRSSGLVLGAHLVGHGAEETIHSFALAIEKALPAREIAERVYAYPTFHSDLRFLV
jgi:glutathione reductase (NADPH)